MQFIVMPKSIDIAGMISPSLVSDWMNTKSVQIINVGCVQKLQGNMLFAWVIEWSKSGMPSQRTFRNFTHQVWGIWNLSNHDLFWIIPDPGSQKRITLSRESISTIRFLARPVMSRFVCGQSTVPTATSLASTILFPPLSWQGISPMQIQPCFFSVWWMSFRILPIGSFNYQASWSPEKLVNWALMDGQMTGTIVALEVNQCCLSDHVSPAFILAAYSARLGGCKVHCLKIEVVPKWELYQQELWTLQSCPAV